MTNAEFIELMRILESEYDYWVLESNKEKAEEVWDEMETLQANYESSD